jgi:hypothetical protein
MIDALREASVKINDPGNPGKMYICGKGIAKFDPMRQRAQRLLGAIRDADSSRIAVVIDRLALVFTAAGLSDERFTVEAIKQRVVNRHGVRYETVYLQERHVAQAFQEVLFDRVDTGQRIALLGRAFDGPVKCDANNPVAVQNEIRSQLMKAGKRAYVPETFVDFKHAYKLILALGGIPSYPVLIDGASPICGYEESPEVLITNLKALGVHAAEFIPNRNSPQMLSLYVHSLRNAGLFVTAGTEHNTLDLLPIAPACLGGEPIPEDIAEIFWEGACVVMAHQFLVMTGAGGFVDAYGEPNPRYTSTSGRIDAFRRLGAALFARYLERLD